MQIVVAVTGGENINITCESTDTIASIKSQVATELSVAEDRITLALSGTDLVDTDTVDDSNIQDGDTITCTVAALPAINLTVEVNSTNVNVECVATDTIGSIKAQVATEISVDAERLTLLKDNTELVDSSTVESNNLQTGDTLTCTVAPIIDTEIKLDDIAAKFADNLLISVREKEIVNEEIKEKLIVSFKTNERTAIREELLARKVEKCRIEINPSKDKHDPVVVVILKTGV